MVVTVAYRSRSPLAALLERIPPPTQIVVVDNSSADEDISDLVRARPMTTRIDAGGNVGFGAACNLAAAAATQPFLAFINPDADVDAEVLDLLIQAVAGDPRCSSAGPILVDADGVDRSGSGGWLPTPWRAAVHASGLLRLLPDCGIWIGPGSRGLVPVQWIAGTCLVIRTDAFREAGGFNPQYFLYQEDMDLGRRLCERGWRQVLASSVRVGHAAGTSSSRTDIRHLTWLRASALVDYLMATSRPSTARLMCVVLAAGGILRAAREILGGRTGRLGELATYAITLLRPSRTLARVHAERRRRMPVPLSTRGLQASLDGSR